MTSWIQAVQHPEYHNKCYRSTELLPVASLVGGGVPLVYV
jgi:hypothetical protein